MAERHFVVIGNGPAGNQAARTLRERATGDRITIVSRARQSCYSPHHLPDYIAGKISEAELLACPIESYKAENIKLRTCQSVAGVDLKEGKVILEHNEVIPYDGLIIAVGGKPRIPERLRPCRGVMYSLKTLEDAKVWIEKLKEVDSATLLGGDLTSLAVARALLHLGKKVSFVLNEEAFWPLRADEELLGRVAVELTAKGVEVFAPGSLGAIVRLPDGAYEARIDGKTVRSGMFGAFFGLVPDVGFLAGSGLRIDRGILVDEYLNTGFRNVYAAGDCAQIYHPSLQDYWVSVGYANAALLGETAALNLSSTASMAEVEPKSILTVQGIRVNTSWWTEL